jgi:antitoxin VapB
VKTAKVFQTGGSQAIRLPKECRFEAKEVQVKKVGPALVLLPNHGSWDILFEACREFTPEFMSSRSQPKLEKRHPLKV